MASPCPGGTVTATRGGSTISGPTCGRSPRKSSAMRYRRFLNATIVMIALCALLAAACGVAAPATQPASRSAAGSNGTPDRVTLQLKWVTQAQFAGYYAALEQGFYRAEHLDVTILPGGPDVAPEPVVAGNQAEFGID